MLKKVSLMAFLLLLVSYGRANTINALMGEDKYIQEYGSHIEYDFEGDVQSFKNCSFALELSSLEKEKVLADYSEGTDINILLKSDSNIASSNHYTIESIKHSENESIIKTKPRVSSNSFLPSPWIELRIERKKERVHVSRKLKKWTILGLSVSEKACSFSI